MALLLDGRSRERLDLFLSETGDPSGDDAPDDDLPDAGRKAALKAAEEVDEVMSFRFLLDDPELGPRFTEDNNIRYVVNFFERLTVDLGLTESAFLKNEALQKDFIKRFKAFDRFVEDELKDVERILRGNSECTNGFGKGWQDRAKKACYHVFFVHYGEKRRGEVDKTSHPKDYVYHPVRSAFNCLIRKIRFFDEKTFLTTILHDTGEDFHKGIIGLMHVEERTLSPQDLEANKPKVSLENARKRAKEREIDVFRNFEKVEKYLDLSIEPFFPQSTQYELSITELRQILTKSTSDRNRALLEIFEKIGEIFPPEKRISAIRLIMAKLADRIDNLKTLTTGGKSNLKSGQIEDESIYVFLALARKFGMTNIADWMYDYIWLKDPQRRTQYTGQRRAAERLDQNGQVVGKDKRIRSEFKREVRDKLRVYLNNPDLEEGSDYVLEFRDLGHRHENPEEATSALSRGDYAKAFRGYIIFHPVSENERLAQAARKVFGEIFATPLYERNAKRSEINRTALGKLVVENGGAGENSDYGTGVWCVFDSQREGVSNLLGDFHEAWFYGNAECRARFLGVFTEIEGMIKHLANQYRLLQIFETASSEESDPAFVRAMCGKEIQRILCPSSSQAGQCEKFISPEVRLKIEQVLLNIMMCIFMRRKKRVDVALNGDHEVVTMPQDAPLLDGALAFRGPLLLGRRIGRKRKEFSARSLLSSLCARATGLGPAFPYSVMALETDGTSFEIDPKASFDGQLFADQTAFFRPLLSGYRQQLLQDEIVGLMKKRRR